jgi:YggT family protein
MISVLASVSYVLVYIFFVALWARFIFDWVRVLAKSFRPQGPVLLLAEAAYTITDKPLAAVRKFIPPLRFGGAAIDLAWSVLLVGTLVALSLLDGLR